MVGIKHESMRKGQTSHKKEHNTRMCFPLKPVFTRDKGELPNFMDEPTIGLDVVMKDNVRNAVKKINQNLGTTVVLTTHDMSDIELLADKIVMIDHGKMIFEGDTLDLKEIYGDGTLEEIVKNIYCRGNQ